MNYLSLYDYLILPEQKLNNLKTMPLAVSILDHLQHLLNTRQGTIAHMPDYGMVECDMQRLDDHFYSEQLCQTLVDIISRYEPRLQQLRACFIKQDKVNQMLLSIRLSGTTLEGQAISMCGRYINDSWQIGYEGF